MNWFDVKVSDWWSVKQLTKCLLNIIYYKSNCTLLIKDAFFKLPISDFLLSLPYVENQASCPHPFFFLLQWFTWAHSLLTQFRVFWLHNYRIIASLYLTQQGVLNHWNHEITDWDGMICRRQQYYQLSDGRERLQGEAPARSTSPQPVLVSAQGRSQRPQPRFDALWPWTQGEAARLRK